MLSPSVSVPAFAADAPRPGEQPLDSRPAAQFTGRRAQAADVSTILEGSSESVSPSPIPSSHGNIRQPHPRPRSLAESSIESPTSLQRHFHHQRHQSSSDLRPSSSLSPAITAPDGLRLVEMPLTGDNRGAAQSPTSRGILSGWLPGSPAEATRALRSRGSTPLSPGATPTKAPKTQPPQQTTPTSKVTASPNNSRFAFISSSLSALTRSGPAQSPTHGAADDDDQLASLNIEEALFPPSSPGEARDPFSPASYKNLEMTASSLLATYQTAYRRQRHEIRELQMDRDAKNEEMEETDMRTRHLKLQLEDLARQAAEREQEMQALLLALEKERKLNRDGGLAPPPSSDSVTVVSEDLNAEEDQKHRQWRKSHNFEDTDEESESIGEAPSVFSRSRSPTFAAAAAQQKGPPQQMNAFQKLVKGFTGEADAAAAAASSTATCRNCQGQDGQVAWDTVGLLRDENRGLKARVAELEQCVEEALDAVNGLRL